MLGFGIRRFTKILRGKATPTQVVLAAMLGVVLGFVPGTFLLGFGGGLAQSPALIATLLVLVLVLQANLAVFAASWMLGKLGAVLLLPVSFEVGRWLLDGPLQPLFAALVNAPVIAWFGLEHYAVTGGLVLGLLLGSALGIALARGITSFRRYMASLEEGSQAYKKWSGKLWVRALAWLLLGGGKGKRTWDQMLHEHRRGPPVRIAGVVVVVVLAAGGFVLQSFLAGPGLRAIAQKSLESWNGATVDLAKAAVDLAGGRVVVSGLAMADAARLENDAFRARSLDVTLATTDLLRKRFVVDSITSNEAATGIKRATPGERIEGPAPPTPEPPGDQKTLEDYLAEAEKWKQRLQQLSEWLQRLAGPGGGEPGETPEERNRRILESERLKGLARARAPHLIQGAPLLLVRRLTFDGVRAGPLGDDLLDVRATNLSTNPSLVSEPLTIEIASRSGRFGFRFGLGDGGATTRFFLKGIAAETVAGELKKPPIQGGTLDLAIDGKLDLAAPGGVRVDLPLRVTLHDTTLALPGLEPTPVRELAIPLGLRGPLAAPAITLDDKALADALVAAGKQKLADEVRRNASKLLGDKVPGAGGLGDVIEGKKTPAQLLEEAKRQAEEAARKKAEEELKKRLPGGLFGGKK